MNTPDTEWREKVRDWWYSVQDLLNEEVNVSLPEHKRVEIEQIIKEVIFSRDTYWKERVIKLIWDMDDRIDAGESWQDVREKMLVNFK